MNIVPLERNQAKTRMLAITCILNYQLNRNFSVSDVENFVNEVRKRFLFKLDDFDLISRLLKSRHELRTKFDAEDIVFELIHKNPVICKFKGNSNYGVITGYERRGQVKFFIYDPMEKVNSLGENEINKISRIEYWVKK